MPPARAFPALALLAALSAALAAPASPAGTTPAPASSAGTTTAPDARQAADTPDSVDTTTPSDDDDDVDLSKYPSGSRGPERPGFGEGSGRIFSQLVAPLVQLVVNQLLQAANLVSALAGAGRPNSVLTVFSSAIGALSGGGAFPAKAPAPPVL